MATIDRIEGIGPGYAQTLRDAGISSVEGLLEAACEKSARTELSKATGINEKLILKWVNMADLFRINGVGSQYAELLEHAGVDTVAELAQRNAESLHSKMQQANDAKPVVRQLPALKIVQTWITEAKTLPRKVNH